MARSQNTGELGQVVASDDRDDESDDFRATSGRVRLRVYPVQCC
jgi:trehalose-6-phosphatase